MTIRASLASGIEEKQTRKGQFSKAMTDFPETPGHVASIFGKRLDFGGNAYFLALPMRWT